MILCRGKSRSGDHYVNQIENNFFNHVSSSVYIVSSNPTKIVSVGISFFNQMFTWLANQLFLLNLFIVENFGWVRQNYMIKNFQFLYCARSEDDLWSKILKLLNIEKNKDDNPLRSVVSWLLRGLRENWLHC